VTSAKLSRRNGLALGLSALFHMVLVAVLLSGNYRPYDLPAPPTEPVEIEIERVPQPEIIPPPPIERHEVTPQQPTPQRPAPTPPVVTPPIPTPVPTPSPQPAPVVAKVRPVTPVQSPKPSPLAAKTVPNPSLSPVPTPVLTPAPVVAAAPKPVQATASAPVTSQTHLNIHKSEKEAPAGVATLQMAPSPTAPRSGAGGSPPGAQEAGMNSSRLKGLSPFPPGSLPSGGPGLRGSLVGCANSQAVGLSAVERAHCAERFGVDVARAPHLDGMSPDKRAGFDHQVAKANAWRAYRDSIPANGTDPGPNGMGRLGSSTPDSVLQTIPH
jgi:hypothetical protein